MWRSGWPPGDGGSTYSYQGYIFISFGAMMLARVTASRDGVLLQLTPQAARVTMMKIGFVARLLITVLLSLAVVAAIVTLYGGGG